MTLTLDTYRLLGRSGLRVSPLALGTATFGTEWGWGAARTGRDQLAGWLDQVKDADVPELVSFVNGIGSDLGAVVAGLSLPFSSGAVEGQVNRVILWNQRCQAVCLCITSR